MYNKESMKAEEFIDHEEVLRTLEYAEKNKNNLELIDKILDKARPIRDGKQVHCNGLTHEEASILLASDKAMGSLDTFSFLSSTIKLWNVLKMLL